ARLPDDVRARRAVDAARLGRGATAGGGWARPCRRAADDRCARAAAGGRGGRGGIRVMAALGLFGEAGPVIPNFGAGSSGCVVHNRFFCADWVEHNWGPVLWPALRGHIALTLVAVGIGFVISMTLALAAHRYRLLEQPTVLVTTFLYTIPSLALFELLVAPVGANVYSAEIALVSYTLLILFRNIRACLRCAPAEVMDAADGMGMTRTQSLLRVELPLALPAIVAGIRIAVVTTIALATIVYTIYDA